MESTYGDRLHTKPQHDEQQVSTTERARELAQIIRETFGKGGNVIIPSFAVGRTQELLYLLGTSSTGRCSRTYHTFPSSSTARSPSRRQSILSRNIEDTSTMRR
jgi:metallo-beta-lactamase family protein